MKNKKKYSHLTLVKAYEPAYPNAADHNYFAQRVLNVVTAVVSGLGFISAMGFLVTMI
jgi:hypothetical protein